MYARSNKRKNDSFLLYKFAISLLDDVLFCLWVCDIVLIYFKIDPAKIGGILALVNIVSTVLQPFISQVIIKKERSH